MFTTVARLITWWANESPEGETDPIMIVARSLARVDTDAKDFNSWRMDRRLAAGMLFGVVEQKELTQMQVCLDDIVKAKTVVHEGFNHIWELNSWDIDAGLVMIVNALDLVPGLQEDCTNADDDWAKLDDWSTIFYHPVSLFTSVESNLVQYKTILTMAAITATQQLAIEDYFGTGQTLGKMLSILTDADIASLYW